MNRRWRLMSRFLDLLALLVVGAMSLTALGGGSHGATSAINAADFQAKVDNTLLPLSTLGPQLFEGEERDPDTSEIVRTRVESAVLPTTDKVAGVEVTVVNEKDYQNGELVESTLDYFAQHRSGDVYYFGERVDTYEGGKIVGHEGSWLAGEGKNQPGIIMPAHPTVGQKFQQEKAPGIAEDELTVLSLTESVTVPAGSFTGCLKATDFNPLDSVTEHKWYCPGVGMVHEEFPEGHLDLVQIGSPGSPTPAPTIAPTAAPTAAPPQPTQVQAPAGMRAPNSGTGTTRSGNGLGSYGWGLVLLGTIALATGTVIPGRRAVRWQRQDSTTRPER
jgi:hypothetical protein